MDDSVREALEDLREQIDACDADIRQIIGERNDLVAAIQSLKRQHDLPVWDQKRVDEIIDGYIEELGDIDGIRIATAIVGTQEQLEKLAE